MNKNLLIVGAGIYGRLTKEIAEGLNCYERIAFLDDNSNSLNVVGRVDDMDSLTEEYGQIIVAIGNPDIRASLYERIADLPYKIATVISDRAYVSPSAAVAEGCIIEPMAVVHSECCIERGCMISAGSVINHAAICEAFVHVDCNATVEGYATVRSKTKVCSGTVYKR